MFEGSLEGNEEGWTEGSEDGVEHGLLDGLEILRVASMVRNWVGWKAGSMGSMTGTKTVEQLDELKV
jgi:hypothetical protein